MPFPGRFQSCWVNGGLGIWGLSRWWSSRVHFCVFLLKLKYKKWAPKKTDQSGGTGQSKRASWVAHFSFFSDLTIMVKFDHSIYLWWRHKSGFNRGLEYTNIQIRDFFCKFWESNAAKWLLPPLTTFSPTHFHIKIAFQLLS